MFSKVPPAKRKLREQLKKDMEQWFEQGKRPVQVPIGVSAIPIDGISSQRRKAFIDQL